jgi:uncharacterized cupin superfamily protein
VLEGELTFYIDGQIVKASTGESAFIPRGLPHCFENCSARVARVLVMFTPGHIEGFFDYGLPVDNARPSDARLAERLRDFAPKFGLELIGPSPL